MLLYILFEQKYYDYGLRIGRIIERLEKNIGENKIKVGLILEKYKIKSF